MRLVIALDPILGISPVELAAAWDDDTQARALGQAVVEGSVSRDILPDIPVLVAIPKALNITSEEASTLLSRLVAKLRVNQSNEPPIELTEVTNRYGDPIVVVQLRKDTPHR